MKRIVFVVLICLPVLVAAQVKVADTVIQLNAIEISGTRTGLSLAGCLSEKVDSTKLIRSSNLGEALDNMIQVQVKSNGVSGSSSLYLRGTSSVHNAVFWNGFNIAFGSLGSTDMSLLPAILFDKAIINYGGAASQFGSGVIGGSVNLNNIAAYNKGINAAFLLEKFSFNNFSVSGRAGFSNKKLAVTTAVSFVENENNFRYNNIYKEKDTLTHARFNQISVLQQAGYKTGKNSEIKAGWWYYDAFREISPTLLVPENDQNQHDNALRGFVEYAFTPGLWNLNIKAFLNDEIMIFTSKQAGINTSYHLKSSQIEANAKRIIGRFAIAAGIQQRFQRADVPVYKSDVNESQMALFSSFEYTSFSSKFSTGLYARQDFQSDYNIPFCPSLGLKWMPLKKLEIGTSVSKNFRLPTLNDRYWVPGGNPDILPENSWNQDISIKYSDKNADSRTAYFITLSAYNMHINNLIQWVPVTATIWSPVNRDKVWSRGVSENSTIKFTGSKFAHSISTSYTFSLSTSGASENEHFQLIYIPLHKAGAEYTFGYRKFTAALMWHFIGKRFTTTDNTSFLPTTNLADLELKQSLQSKDLHFDLFFTVKNLFNTDYQMVAGYPESLRYFSFKLIVQYLNSLHNENQ